MRSKGEINQTVRRDKCAAEPAGIFSRASGVTAGESDGGTKEVEEADETEECGVER